MKLFDKPWTYSREDILRALKVSSDKGLNPNEVEKRGKELGPNRLRKAKAKSVWLILADQFKSLLTLLLGVAALLSLIFGDWVEGFAILAVIIINASIGFFTEMKAVRSMEALYRLSSVSVKAMTNFSLNHIKGLMKFMNQTQLTLFATMSRIFPQEYFSLIFPLNLELARIKEFYFFPHLAFFLRNIGLHCRGPI